MGTRKPVGEVLAGGSYDGPFWTLTDGQEQGARPLKPSAPPCRLTCQDPGASPLHLPNQSFPPRAKAQGATRCTGSERHFQRHEADGHWRVTG